MEILTRRHRWYTVLPLAAILVYLLTLTGYWQLIFGAGLLAGILMKRPRGSFAVAGLGGSLAWGIPLAVATRSYPLVDASALLAEILGLPSSMFLLPFVFTFLISGLLTGLGALLGAYVTALLKVGRAEIQEIP